jgi:ABC-2 type transport system ATP-binding protein
MNKSTEDNTQRGNANPRLIRRRELEKNRQAVIARDLAFRYPGEKKRAVDGISFSVKKNEFYGIIGPNGAGKTTLMALLATLLKPHSGELRVLGNDARHSRKIRDHIGLVPQESTLYPSLTVKENLMYFGSLYGLSGRALKARVAQCLEMVDLISHQDRKVKHFSGGMKRRASIALGVVGAPKILLLDEPAANIDIHSRLSIFDKLMALKQEEMTIIYTTHILSDIEGLCDWVTIMDTGRTIAAGTPRELMDSMAGCNSFEAFFLELTGKEPENPNSCTEKPHE